MALHFLIVDYLPERMDRIIMLDWPMAERSRVVSSCDVLPF